MVGICSYGDSEHGITFWIFGKNLDFCIKYLYIEYIQYFYVNIWYPSNGIYLIVEILANQNNGIYLIVEILANQNNGTYLIAEILEIHLTEYIGLLRY